jgi:hypothetical protein
VFALLPHDHYFAAGTMRMGVATNANNTVATAVHPIVMEIDIVETNNHPGSDEMVTTIETGPSMQVLQSALSADGDGPTPIYPTVNADIIIPTAITTHGHSVYLATIHRKLVFHLPASNNAGPYYRIGLGIAKFNARPTDRNAAAASAGLKMEWSRTYQTGIDEIKGEDEAIDELEIEREHFEEDALDSNFRHSYTNDGVLTSGLEVIETDNQEEDSYLLIAGSAPGVKGDEHQNDTTLSPHPFMNERATYIGDWDGFIAKVGVRTGEILHPKFTTSAPTKSGIPSVNTLGVANTWSYTMKTQPQRGDFIQSICVPRDLPELWTHKETYYPKVA